MRTHTPGSYPCLIGGQPVFNAPNYLTSQAHLDYGIDQVPPRQKLNRAVEQGTLEGWEGVWDDYYQAGVQFHFAEEPDKVDAVVRDERVLSLTIRSASSQSGLPLKSRWLTWVASKPAP